MKVQTRRVPISVVLPPNTLLLDVAGPVEALRYANLLQEGIYFDVQYVGAMEEVSTSIGLTLAGIQPLPDTVEQGSIILVSGYTSQPLLSDSTAVKNDAASDRIVEWLRWVVRPGITLVSICSGALLAARAGLLDGAYCTTHFADCHELSRLAPSARVLDNRLYVEDGERYTSAGVTAGIDLMLHIIGRMTSSAVSASVARQLVVYLRRAGTDPQLSPWLQGRNHIHPAIHRVQDAITADPARQWSLESLAALAIASPRHLSRLFNDQTGMSIPEYLNKLRVALAYQLLTETRLDMERVAEQVGFASSRQLRRAWGRLHLNSPSAVRRRA